MDRARKARAHNAGICLIDCLARRRDRRPTCRQTAPCCRCQIVVKPEDRVGPIEFVWLLTDSEIEVLQTEPNCVSHKLTQMKRPRPVARNFAIRIACEYVVITIAKYDAKVCCRADVADFYPADVYQMQIFGFVARSR